MYKDGLQFNAEECCLKDITSRKLLAVIRIAHTFVVAMSPAQSSIQVVLVMSYLLYYVCTQ